MSRKSRFAAVAAAFLGAFIPTGLMLRMLADNNNNGEIRDTVTGQWEVGHLVEVSAIIYFPSFLIILVLSLGAVHLWHADGP